MLYDPSGFWFIWKLFRSTPKGFKNIFPRFLRPPTTSVFIFSNFS